LLCAGDGQSLRLLRANSESFIRIPKGTFWAEGPIEH
jgi:hypothetical protein